MEPVAATLVFELDKIRRFVETCQQGFGIRLPQVLK
jgi:hypothetical protein